MSDKAAPTGAIATLIERMEAHDAEGVAIREEAAKLNLDAARIKAIRKAKAEAAAIQKTLAELMAENLIPEGSARTLGGEA